MQPIGENTIQVKRRIVVALVVLLLCSSFAAVMNIQGDPEFPYIRRLNVVRLLAIGACWGMAVGGLALLIGEKLRKG